MSGPAIACFWKDRHDSFVKECDSDSSSKCRQKYQHDSDLTSLRSHPGTSGNPGHHEKCLFVHFHGITHDTARPHILFAKLCPWKKPIRKADPSQTPYSLYKMWHQIPIFLTAPGITRMIISRSFRRLRYNGCFLKSSMKGDEKCPRRSIGFKAEPAG